MSCSIPGSQDSRRRHGGPPNQQPKIGPTLTPLHGDPIRIVPLSVPDELLRPAGAAAPAAAPHLTYRGGPLLTNVQVFTVFWAGLEQPASVRHRRPAQRLLRLHPFTSPLIDQLAQYNVNGLVIGHGQRTGTAVVISPPLRRSDIRHRRTAHAAAPDRN